MEARRLAMLALPFLCGCPSGLDRRIEGSVDLPANENIGQAFEPGVAPSSAINDDIALCGAVIPGATGQPNVQLTFLVFTTATSALNADGTGVPLVHETPPPQDSNNASDVFAAAIVRSSNPGNSIPNAFTQAIAPVMRHPRCVTCHSFHYPGGFGDSQGHTGGNSDGTNTGCLGCHDADIGLSESGTAVGWRAPLLSQGDLRFAGKTTQQLYDQTIQFSDPDVVGHLKQDDRIFWAIERGLDPNGNNLGDVPISKLQWNALVDAWAAGNFLFDTSGAVRDLTLVSRTPASTVRAGNAASVSPHAVYVPNAGYDPNSTAPQVAGRIHVVFASDASDFDGAAHSGRDVWRTIVEVRMNEDPAAGLADPGKINLLVRADLMERMSRSPALAGGNGDSDHPRISSDAQSVVFDSKATNLVAGFTDANGAGSPDVYLVHPGGATTLVSHAFGSATIGGNLASANPSVSAAGQAIAFETRAQNLTNTAFQNGEQNIALTVIPGVTTQYVSVTTAGAAGFGGACRRPSVFVDGAGTPLVVFESEKTDLVDDAGEIVDTQIYLRTSGTTRLVSRAGSRSGNGESSRPSLSSDGKTIVFQSAATNLDTVRPNDSNNRIDVLRFDVDALLANAALKIERISIAPDGSDADGASSVPVVSNFSGQALDFTGGTFCFYRTLASNVGRGVNTDAMLVFLAPTAP